jgi:hypothetical protein
MIIIPDPVPRLPTDYDGVWQRLSLRTRRLIVVAALIPVAVGAFVLATSAWNVGYLAILLAFSIWGPIGAYFANASDQIRQRRRLERPQFKALEGAELSDAERRDAVYEAQRRAAIEDMKRRRG